jgi:glycosyltransferase involved in cell wall biosynthesis
LACGTPVIVTMTGGLQEQVTNGKEWFGWGIKPTAKSIIGSLQVPYIYEDRISQLDFEKTMNKALKLPKTRYKKMSDGGIKHVKENFSFENYEKQWVNFMDKVILESGSWETRKNYKRWHLMEVA